MLVRLAFQLPISVGSDSIPVEDERFDFKLEAIMKHKSQAEGMLKKMQNMPDEMKIYIEGLKERLGKERFFVWKFE